MTSTGWRPGSLQARLLLTVLGLVGAVWLMVLAMTWTDTRHELNELLDAHLAQTAALIAVHATDQLDDDDLALAPMLHKYQPRVAFQVWRGSRLLARSGEAPDEALSSRQTAGLSRSQVGGRAWRVFTALGRDPELRVHVGELQSARREILLASLHSVTWPTLLALPLLVLGIWWAVRGAVRPLRQLGEGVAARRPQALDPLPTQGVAPEVLPLITALNGLFERMTAQLAAERRFTADAAHELRTPIAAIRIQAQVAQGASTDAERASALEATVRGCDRATRLVEQLLQLARLEAEVDGAAVLDDGREGMTDLALKARGLVLELTPQAQARGQTVTLDAPDAVPVPISAPLAMVLLRNLLDNALRYSPQGARVQVRLTRDPEVSLIVEDSGPGLPDGALERLGERFFRVLGTGQPGSGLGWSIVRRICRLYGLAVEVGRSAALGGLCVQVRWPRPDR